MFVESSSLDDWWTIEEPVGPGRTRRLCDADIEGDSEEMLAIAEAIEQRGRAAFKRCSVGFADGACFLSSPRNSTREARISLADADALAADIRSKVGAR
ncbi:MAG: hypothetical protein ACTHU0_19245 [Kofleriaceae bacterium]